VRLDFYYILNTKHVNRFQDCSCPNRFDFLIFGYFGLKHSLVIEIFQNTDDANVLTFIFVYKFSDPSLVDVVKGSG
jgi:hypothetical protein